MTLLPADEYRKTRGIIRRGTRAVQPSASSVLEGTIYFVTDEGLTERSNGSAWESFSGAGGGGAGIQGLRGIPGMDGIDGEDSESLIVLNSSFGGLISQGLWTPSDSSGAGLAFTLTTPATWIKIGPLVVLSFDISYPVTANAATSRIGGIPFALISSNNGFGGFMTSTNYNTSVNEITFFSNTTTFDFRDTGGAAITNAALSGKVVRGTVIYQTAK